MQGTTRSKPRFTLARIGLGIGALFYVLLAASSVAGASGPRGFHAPILAVVLVFAPALAFLALRYPLIFPFGLYVALVPFDSLLTVSSGATLVRLLGALTGFALAVRILVLRRFVPPTRAWYLWLAFVAWSGISLIWTIDLPESQRVFGIIVQNFAMMSLIAFYPLEERELKWLLAVAIVAGMGAGLVAIYQFQTSAGHAVEGRLSFVSGRFYVDPNYFATSFLLPLTLAIGAAMATRRQLLRIGCWLAAGVMMVGVLLSGSRGGFIALAIVLVYFALRSRNLMQTLVISALGVALTVRYPTVWMRFLHDPEGDGSGSGRTLIWQVGFQALKHSWLFGNGIGSFPETYARYFLSAYEHVNQGWHRPAHNVLLGMGVEVGIFGLALLLLAWYQSFRQLNAIPRTSPRYPLRIAVEATLLGLFAQSLFIDPIWIKYVWLSMTMPYVLLNVGAARTIGRRVRVPRVPAFGPRHAPAGG